jgi:hypothetical protein
VIPEGVNRDHRSALPSWRSTSFAVEREHRLHEDPRQRPAVVPKALSPRKRHREHPLPQIHGWQHVLDEMRRRGAHSRSRLAASVPAPRLHTVRYARVLASASKLRARLAPKPAVVAPENPLDMPESPGRGADRPWADGHVSTANPNVRLSSSCSGRMKLLALVTDPTSVGRFGMRPSDVIADATRP